MKHLPGPSELASEQTLCAKPGTGAGRGGDEHVADVVDRVEEEATPMALFGPADKDRLSVLTQIYQLEGPEEEREFYLRFVTERETRVHPVRAASQHHSEGAREFVRFVVEHPWNPDTDLSEDLRCFGHLCRCVREIMTQLADKQDGAGDPAVVAQAYADFTAWLEGLTFTYSADFYPEDLFWDSKKGKGFILPTQPLAWRNLGIRLWAKGYHGSAIPDAVLAMGSLLAQDASVGRCPECKNVFVRTLPHRTHEFCSKRCSARAGERRRYKERKDGKILP
jgi:hypothetical protein